MAKVIYNLRARDKESGETVIRQARGYTFDVDGISFGVTGETWLPDCEKAEAWHVTELHTGYWCAVASTKKAAIAKILDAGMLAKVESGKAKAILAGITNCNPNTAIQDYYGL